MRTTILLFSLVPFLDAASQDGQERIDLIEKVSPAVVCVMSLSGPGGGSGVIIDPDGTVLTNFHVVAGSLGAMGKGKPGYMKCGTPDGELRLARIIGLDPGGDLAILRLERRKYEKKGPFPCAPLGTQADLRIGDFVLAMGNPFLLATDFKPTVTLGIVSGLHRYMPGRRGKLVYPDCIQTDAAVNPGNSGGPLFNMEGKVVGINGRISVGERGRVNVGVGFAVSGDMVKMFMPGLRAGKLCAHGSLRLDSREMDEGLTVVAVEEGGPAWNAGIRIGDILLTLDGEALKGQNDLLKRITSMPSGWPVEIAWKDKDKGRTKVSWVRLAPLAPDDPRLADWEPVGLDAILKYETKRLEKKVSESLGIKEKRVSIPGKMEKRILKGSRNAVTAFDPPLSVLPENGALLPPFPGGAEFDGGDRVDGNTAYVVLLPGRNDRKLFIHAETYLPLGTAFTPNGNSEEVRILVTSWQKLGSCLFPRNITWKFKGKVLLEEEIVLPREKRG